MPDIPLDLRAIDYATDEGLVVRAWRAFLDVRFIGQNALRFRSSVLWTRVLLSAYSPIRSGAAGEFLGRVWELG